MGFLAEIDKKASLATCFFWCAREDLNLHVFTSEPKSDASAIPPRARFVIEYITYSNRCQTRKMIFILFCYHTFVIR